MHDSIAGVFKGSATKITVEWGFLNMISNMNFKICMAEKCFTAHDTSKTFRAQMNRADV